MADIQHICRICWIWLAGWTARAERTWRWKVKCLIRDPTNHQTLRAAILNMEASDMQDARNAMTAGCKTCNDCRMQDSNIFLTA